MASSFIGTSAATGALPSAAELAAMLRDARQRSLELMADLSDEQLKTPLLAIINPPLWEFGHLAWFQEKWVLRHLRGERPVLQQGDVLFDSAAIVHDTRWDLPLLSRQETLAYAQRVLNRVLEVLASDELTPELAYFCWLATMHEDMHGEAFTYTRQTLAYPEPTLSTRAPDSLPTASAVCGDAEIPGGDYLLGARPRERFVFDNEKWEHPVRIEPFRLARAAVTEGEFAAFVNEGGYRRPEFWGAEGWQWRENAKAEYPVYWQRDGQGWQVRHFDRWRPLAPERAIIHVNWYEADAYCRWAGRRLPTEAEWELAASGEAANINAHRRFPWGEEPPAPERANLDGRRSGTVAATAYEAGQSAFGCRQMVGNVWEWSANTFGPYPGFVPDPYKEYSQPWFTGEYKVLRGGCWATRARLIRNTWRNFYTKDRRDVFAGFRTCAL